MGRSRRITLCLSKKPRSQRGNDLTGICGLVRVKEIIIWGQCSVVANGGAKLLLFIVPFNSARSPEVGNYRVGRVLLNYWGRFGLKANLDRYF